MHGDLRPGTVMLTIDGPQVDRLRAGARVRGRGRTRRARVPRTGAGTGPNGDTVSGPVRARLDAVLAAVGSAPFGEGTPEEVEREGREVLRPVLGGSCRGDAGTDSRLLAEGRERARAAAAGAWCVRRRAPLPLSSRWLPPEVAADVRAAAAETPAGMARTLWWGWLRSEVLGLGLGLELELELGLGLGLGLRLAAVGGGAAAGAGVGGLDDGPDAKATIVAPVVPTVPVVPAVPVAPVAPVAPGTSGIAQQADVGVPFGGAGAATASGGQTADVGPAPLPQPGAPGFGAPPGMAGGHAALSRYSPVRASARLLRAFRPASPSPAPVAAPGAAPTSTRFPPMPVPAPMPVPRSGGRSRSRPQPPQSPPRPLRRRGRRGGWRRGGDGRARRQLRDDDRGRLESGHVLCRRGAFHRRVHCGVPCRPRRRRAHVGGPPVRSGAAASAPSTGALPPPNGAAGALQARRQRRSGSSTGSAGSPRWLPAKACSSCSATPASPATTSAGIPKWGQVPAAVSGVRERGGGFRGRVSGRRIRAGGDLLALDVKTSRRSGAHPCPCPQRPARASAGC